MNSRYRLRILVVDDEPAIRSLMADIIERAGYKTILASSGPAALAAWRKSGGAVDVLVSDIDMPGMSGGELAKTLRVLYAQLSVVLMSGGYGDCTSAELIARGEVVFVPKPFTTTELLKGIRQALRQGSLDVTIASPIVDEF
jgi:CheY-like chemotaxis protein